MVQRDDDPDKISFTIARGEQVDRSAPLSGLTDRPRMIGSLEENIEGLRVERADRLGMVGASTARTQQRSTAAFGLLAARVVASLRRLALGKPPDDVDRQVLSSASDYLRKEAAVLTYVEGNRDAAFSVDHIRSAGLAAGVLRSVAIAKNEGARLDSAAVDDLAKHLDGLLANPQADEAQRLEVVFKAITATARAVTGATGDRVVRGRPGSYNKRG